jgi:hypothetical protein
MAIQSVNEMWSTKDGDLQQDGKKITRTYRKAFQVVHDTNDPRDLIERASGIPRIGDAHERAPFVRVKNISSTPRGPIMSIVNVTYAGEVDRDEENKSPVTFKPDIQWSDVTSIEAIDEDINGEPIVTATGEPIDGLTEEINDPIVTIKKNFLTFDSYLMYQYRRSISSDSFLGYPPGVARMVNYSAVMQYYEDTDAYWAITAQIQFRVTIRTVPERAWWKRIRHEGFYCFVDDPFNPGTKIKVRARDENNEPTTRPVLLKEDGTQETDPTKAFWLEKQTRIALPYNSLGLLT